MKNKITIKLLILCLLALIVVPVLKADYYEPDLFPIGLTSIYGDGTPPYQGNGWVWDGATNSERALIEALGVNCIGCEPCNPYYLTNLTKAPNDTFNYLYQVCKRAGTPGSDDAIYIMLEQYKVTGNYYRDLDCSGNRVEESKNGVQYQPSAFFGQQNYTDEISQPWAPLEFHPRKYIINTYPDCLKTKDDNWNTYDGTAEWKNLLTSSINEYRDFLTNNSDADYIWGYNLLVETPALARKCDEVHPWHGVIKASSKVITDFRKNVDVAVLNKHTMIVAKGALYPMHRMGYDIFTDLPDIDVFMIHSISGTPALWNYGDQEIFDQILYCSDHSILPSHNHYDSYNGLQSEAIYFQKYGNSNLKYPEQKRRWIGGMWLEWRTEKSTDPQNPTKIRGRRPCPPEIRCYTYLNLSRGAKGIFFVCWSGSSQYEYPDDSENYIDNKEPYVSIPVSIDKYSAYFGGRGVGLRDNDGYPFGDWGTRNKAWYDQYYSTRHRLNNGTTGDGSSPTYWHQNNYDYTYRYLADTLIPEIKLIAPVLMQLDWVNGYSLNSTDPNWALPCPHDYVMDVSGVSYMDLGLFDHPYEPIGVEYFMLVNREGIADMTNRTVTVALDAGHWPEEDTLILTDIANSDRPRRLSREGDRFTFTEVFEPGEGKFYRAAPKNEAPVTYESYPKGGVE